MAILRQVLGVLSLVVGIALLGECAAHTMRSLLAQGVEKDLSLFLLKGAYFAPGRHGGAYQILLGLGVVLTLLGVILTRTWALPFFLLGGVCLAVLGGLAVERVIVPKGPEAALVQDGASALGKLFTQGRVGDQALLLGLGVFGILTGLYLTHGLRPVPARAPARAAARAPQASARAGSVEETPLPDLPPEPAAGETGEADDPGLAPTPADPLEPAPEAPAPDDEASAETVHDPDLGPEAHDLDTSEVQVPDLPSAPAGAPELEPEPAAPPEPPPPPTGGAGLSVAALVLGLLSLAGPAALFLAPLPEGTASLAWEGGTALSLAGLGLGCLAHPRRLPGKIGLGVSAAGLVASGAVLGLGL